MGYTSVEYINVITNAMLLLMSGALTIRAGRDFLEAYEKASLTDALEKVKKRIFAAIVAISSTGIVIFVQRFY